MKEKSAPHLQIDHTRVLAYLPVPKHVTQGPLSRDRMTVILIKPCVSPQVFYRGRRVAGLGPSVIIVERQQMLGLDKFRGDAAVLEAERLVLDSSGTVQSMFASASKPGTTGMPTGIGANEMILAGGAVRPAQSTLPEEVYGRAPCFRANIFLSAWRSGLLIFVVF